MRLVWGQVGQKGRGASLHYDDGRVDEMESLAGVRKGEVYKLLKRTIGERRHVERVYWRESLQSKVARDIWCVARLKRELVNITYETLQECVFFMKRLRIVRYWIGSWHIRMSNSIIYVLELAVTLSYCIGRIIKSSAILPIGQSIPDTIFLTVIDPSLNQNQIFFFDYLILIPVSRKCLQAHCWL